MIFKLMQLLNKNTRSYKMKKAFNQKAKEMLNGKKLPSDQEIDQFFAQVFNSFELAEVKGLFFKYKENIVSKLVAQQKFERVEDLLRPKRASARLESAPNRLNEESVRVIESFLSVDNRTKNETKAKVGKFEIQDLDFESNQFELDSQKLVLKESELLETGWTSEQIFNLELARYQNLK